MANNLIAAPRVWKKKSIYMKLESSYGTDASPSSADWMEARNLQVSPIEAKMVDRGILLDSKGRVGQLMANAHTKLSFDIALATSGGTGGRPKWDVMMQAAGWANTFSYWSSFTYNLVSSGEKSATVYYFEDGTRQEITGVRGSWKLSMDASGLPLMSFEGQGLYREPTSAGNVFVPDKSGWMVEEPLGALRTTGTFNGVAVAFSKYEVDQANTVNYVNLPGPQEEVVIADRAPTASMTILAPDLSLLNPYALMANADVLTATVNHGTRQGNKVSVTVRSRITGLNEVDVEGYLGYQISMQPEATSAGNDEIVLMLT